MAELCSISLLCKCNSTCLDPNVGSLGPANEAVLVKQLVECLAAVLAKSLLSQRVWAVVTKYHRLRDLYTTNVYFSQFWRLGSPRSWLADLMSGEGPLSGCRLPALHPAEGARDLSVAPPSWPNQPQRPRLLTQSHWGLGFNIRILGEHKLLVHNHLLRK